MCVRCDGAIVGNPRVGEGVLDGKVEGKGIVRSWDGEEARDRVGEAVHLWISSLLRSAAE